MRNMEQNKYKKVYIDVNVRITKEGMIRPMSIVWVDGKQYKVDRIKYITPRASTKVGGRGMMYDVVIMGKERCLYDEDGKWFVEAQVY